MNSSSSAQIGGSKPRLGELLVGQGVISRHQLDEALVAQGSSLLPIGSTLIKLGYATESQVALALAEQYGVPAVHLSACTLETQLLSVIPREVATRHRVLPMAFSGPNALSLVVAKPSEQVLLDEIAFASGRSTLPFVAPRLALDRTIQEAYEKKAAGESLWRGSESTAEEPHLALLQSSCETDAMEPEAPEEALLDTFPEPPVEEPRTARSNPRVLAVDDEPEILEIIETALGMRGIEVIRATRGREALDLLRSTRPDLILLDAMLPEIHGFELCNQIKKSKKYKHLPVIIISAIYTGWNFVQDVKRIYGADDYIAKPFRVMELVHRVEETLQRTAGQPKTPETEQAKKEAGRSVRIALEKLKKGDVPGGIEAADRAVTADPFDPRAHFVLASALNASGQFYEAISAFERVVELAPDQFSALKNLAVLYERQGFRAKAVEMWMRALEQSPNDAVRATIKAHLVDLL